MSRMDRDLRDGLLQIMERIGDMGDRGYRSTPKPKDYRRWTEEEDDLLMRLSEKGLQDWQIASWFDRPVQSVADRRRRVGGAR